MVDEKEIKKLLELISHLNHRQWEMIKTNVDIAFYLDLSTAKYS